MTQPKCLMCGKRFDPHWTGQEVCANRCLVKLWEELPKGRRTKANARRLAKTVGLRSLGEVRFAAHLDNTKVKYEYEPESFPWTPPPRKYTPDFRIRKRKKGGGYMYIEYKGNLRGTDRTKLKLIKKEHLDLDLRIVFERATNKLNRASQTTYAMWAEQYGFPWSEKTIPEDWRKE